ncbi:RTA1-like protein [Boletus edulis]|nr:RTA1-like protein [Boletus edulis]
MARRYRFVESILVAILALMTPIVDGQTVIGPPANPFLDPKDDPYNPLRYITSNTLTAIAFALTYYTFRYGAKWMLAMVIGGYTYSVGFGCRFGLHYHPDSEGITIVEYMFIVLSPCAFIAADYVLFGRLAKHISCSTHVLLPVQKLTFVFVSSDPPGGGLSVTHNQAQRQRGSHIFLAGLVLQLVSFTLFSGIYVRFLYRVYTLERGVWERDKAEPWYRDWRTLAVTLTISCIGILIRSGYRVAELSQGFQGYLATTEAFFYTLDTLPLVIATSVYVLFWPAWFIKDGTRTVHVEPKLSDSL